jgi:hypothetical protein
MATKPGNEHQEPEKKHPYLFYWLTGGLATVLAAVIAVAVAQSSAGPPSPSPGSTASAAFPAPGSLASATAQGTSSASSPATSAAPLERALLPADTLGPGGGISGAGTDLSKIALICGGPLPGATATAYETIVNNQTGQFLSETLTTWDNAADARNASSMNHQGIDQNGSCTLSDSGETATYTGDYAGSAPSSCTSGQYLATMATLSSPSMVSSYSGYLVGTLCGTISVVVEVESDLSDPTQGTANGYLNTAVDTLESAGL